MVAAELKHRNHVPSDYLSITFCDINFYCESQELKNKLENLAHIIEFYKYDICEEEIFCLSQIKDLCIKHISELSKKLAKIKKENKLWIFNKSMLLEIKSLQKQIMEFNARVDFCKQQIKALENQRFFDSSTLTHKFKEMLATLDFSFKSTSKISDLTSLDVYESLVADEVLTIKLDNVTQKILEKMNKEKFNAKQKYLPLLTALKCEIEESSSAYKI